MPRKHRAQRNGRNRFAVNLRGGNIFDEPPDGLEELNEHC
jgi:hypothetical protein